MTEQNRDDEIQQIIDGMLERYGGAFRRLAEYDSGRDEEHAERVRAAAERAAERHRGALDQLAAYDRTGEDPG